MIDIVDFETWHVDLFDKKEYDKKILDIYGVELLLENNCKAKTVFIDGTCVCCFGIYEDGGLWLLVADDLCRFTMAFARKTKEVLKELCVGKSTYSVCQDDETIHRWMTFLGYAPSYEKSQELQGLIYYEAK